MEGLRGSAWRERVAGYKFTYLLIALLMLVLAPLIVGTSSQRSLLFGTGILVVMLFGVFAVFRHRRALVFALALVVPATIAQVTSFVYGTQHYPQLRLALFAAFLSFTAVIIIQDVLRAEAVTWDKIQGAVCAYLLIGVAWGLLHSWVGVLDPQAFSGAVQAEGYAGVPMIYYSFVTLTTTGYGDITPVTAHAKSLSILEQLTGTFYVAMLIARLAGLYPPEAREETTA